MLVYQGTIANADKVFVGQISVDPASGLIEKVIALPEKLSFSPDRVFDANSIIFPGMGDLHIHARQCVTGRQDYKETYRTAMNAALNGGVLYAGAMPNQPEPVITAEGLEVHKRMVAEVGHSVIMFNYVGIGPGTRPLSFPVPYKAYTGPSVGPLFFKSAKQLEETLRHYKGENVSFHVEDFDVLEKSKGAKTHALRRPVEAVEVALKYVLELIEKYDINAKLCHWSTGGRSFEMIAEHRKRMVNKGLGFNTTLEVSPEHLLGTSDYLAEHPHLWPRWQMNPSPQSVNDRRDLVEGLRTGFIDYLATDHAPHTLGEKFKAFSLNGLEDIERKGFTNLSAADAGRLRDFIRENENLTAEERWERLQEVDYELCAKASCENGTSGNPWLDTFAEVVAYLMGEEGFTPQQVARVTAENPGRFVNEFLDDSFYKGFGRIEAGYVGSFTVINVNSPRVVERIKLQTKVGWSPLEGREFPGRLEAVISRGVDVTGKFL